MKTHKHTEICLNPAGSVTNTRLVALLSLDAHRELRKIKLRSEMTLGCLSVSCYLRWLPNAKHSEPKHNATLLQR